MTGYVYKLDLFNKPPSAYPGKLFAFSKEHSAAIYIDLTDDPFIAVKKAALAALGGRAGLIREHSDFFSELFISLYEQFSLIYLETKHLFIPHTQAFLAKQDANIQAIKFERPQDHQILFLGSCQTLEASIDLIKKKASSYTLAACYSVLPFLEKQGITVDLCFALDPLQKEHNSKNARLLLIAPKTKASILEGFTEVAYFPESFCAFSSYLFKSRPQLWVYGYTVADTAIKFLLQSGFKSIALCGVSLDETRSYVEGNQTGYKPDFKKAKLHLNELFKNEPGLSYFHESSVDPQEKIPLDYQHEGLDAIHKIESFKSSFEKMKAIDFENCGLAEWLCLEQEPFYQVVMGPLYEKYKLLYDPDSKGHEVRDFYRHLIASYEKALDSQEITHDKL